MSPACPCLKFILASFPALFVTVGLIACLPSRVNGQLPLWLSPLAAPALDSAGHPNEPIDELEDLTRQFNQLYREGRFQEAARVGERALRAAEKSYGAEHAKVAEVLDALGVTYNSLKDYKRALPLIERAIAIIKRTPGEQSKEMVKVLNTLAMNHAAQEKFAEAQDTYEQALAIAEKALAPDDELRATLYNNRGQQYSDQDQFKEAAADYERALNILEKGPGKGLLGRQSRVNDEQPRVREKETRGL